MIGQAQPVSKFAAQPTSKLPAAKAYEIGSTVEDFNLKNIDGKSYSLASIEDAKGYIVIFTSNVCPFAVANEDRMIELHNEMAPKGYPVVAINSNSGSEEETLEAMKTRHDEKGFPFMYLKDESRVYAKFGADKTPHVYLLDTDMIVRYIGAIDDSPREPSDVDVQYVKNALEALESGKTPSPEVTKAIGCPIKTSGGGRGKIMRKRPSPEQTMERMDANKDQMISKEEAKGPLADHFDELDKDKNGVLTKTELSAMGKRKAH